MLFCPCRSIDAPLPGGKDEGPLGKIVSGVIKNLSGKERLSEEDVNSAWRDAAGAAAAKHSRPICFKKATIFVNCDRSSWLYELTVHKKEILKKLSETLKGRKVKDLRFRIGEIKEGRREKTKI